MLEMTMLGKPKFSSYWISRCTRNDKYGQTYSHQSKICMVNVIYNCLASLQNSSHSSSLWFLGLAGGAAGRGAGL